MSESTKPLAELIENLPPEIEEEVKDFVEFLLERRMRKPGKKLRQDWAGALKDYRAQYTSLELHKRASEWHG